MDNFLESNLMKNLQAFGDKLSSNKAISAIQTALMSSMGIIMVGAIFQLTAVILSNLKVISVGDNIYNIIYGPYNLSMNLLSFWVVFQIGFNYAQSLNLKPMTGAINAALCFLLVASSGYSLASMEALTTGNLGGTGLFIAILVGLVTTRIYHFCIERNIVIKMPEVVPTSLVNGFSSIIPLLLSVIFWMIITVGCLLLTGVDFPSLFIGLLSMPLSYLTGFWGMLVLGLIGGFLWILGIHGTLIVYVAIMPVMLEAITSNAAAYQAGGVDALVYYPVLLFGLMATAGGTGNTIGLSILGLKAKSEQLRAVGKVSIIPGIFNINEPVTFGYPIMYNPILAIPYLISIVVPMIIGHIGYSMGILRPSFISVGSIMPIGIGEFIGSLNIWNSVFSLFVCVLSVVIYYPFFKVYDKQLFEKEQASLKNEGGKE